MKERACRPVYALIPSWVWVGLVVLASRLLLLWGLDVWTQGREYTCDLAIHWKMVQAPFFLLRGHTSRLAQYPPLLPLLEAVVARPVQALTSASPMVVMRVTFAVYEALAASLLYRLVHVRVTNRKRGVLVGALIAGPAGWVTSTIMVQDELVAVFGLMMVVSWLAAGRNRLALAACSVAVAAVKIFFLLPLLVLVVLLPSPNKFARLVLALAPMGLVYAVVVAAAFSQGNPLPFSGFVPGVDFGVNLWVLATVQWGVSQEAAAAVSTALAGLFTGGVILLAWFRVPRSDRVDWVALFSVVVSALFLWTWTLFYHVNPEYYVLPVYLMLLLPLSVRMLTWIGLLSVCPWAVNLAFALARRSPEALPDGLRFLLSDGLTPSWIHGTHTILIVVNTVVTGLAALAMTRLLGDFGRVPPAAERADGVTVRSV